MEPDRTSPEAAVRRVAAAWSWRPGENRSKAAGESVTRDMRGRILVFGLVGAMVFAPGFGAAQQQPITGCNAALSCRNRLLGYSTLTGNADGSVLFGVGFRWGPGFQFRIVTPKAASPEPTPSVDARNFHLRHVSLLPPEPTPTPNVAPR